MSKRNRIVRIFAALLALCLLPACALAERQPYPFMEISYEDMTVTEAQAWLEAHATEQSSHWVMDFHGYPMFVEAQMKVDEVSIERILLNDAGEAWSDAEHYRDYTAEDVKIFVHLDRELTKQYGEPDRRFFVSGDNKYQGKLPKGWRFMFPDGQWTEERLMEVFDTDDQLFRAYSVWNNVILELWVRGDWETQFGFCNLLSVQYYGYEQTFVQDLLMVDYPPEI